jgi:hypothetical protein
MELVDDIPVIITERGEIKKFNGVGFTTIAQFPFATKPLFADSVETGNIQNNNTTRPVHPKGMKRVGNQLYIATAFETINEDYPVDERTHAGIWSLDLRTYSLTHLAAPENNQYTYRSSPLMVINNDAGRLFLGGALEQASNNEGIWLEDLSPTTTNYGYFVTTEIPSNSVTDTYDAIYLKGLLDSDCEVVVKYRTERNPDLPTLVENVAWASTTQFNTTADLSAVSVGDEVEFVIGQGAGRLSHITAISESLNTYAITIDEEIGSAGTVSDVQIYNWTKIDKTFTAADGQVKQLGPNVVGTLIQVKVDLRGKGGLPEIREIIIHSNNKQSV